MVSNFPAYADLGGGDIPAGASWGVFGADDQIGTLNFIDQSVTRGAAALVKTGKSFVLGLPQTYFDPPASAGRKNPVHHVKQSPMSGDDWYDDFYPQGSSQWDALRHYRHPKYGGYNGHGDDIQPNNDVLSISHIARKGIATRGVLADFGRYREAIGRPIDQAVDEALTLEDLRDCLASQNVELTPGCVLLVRTGWLTYFRNRVNAGNVLPRGWDLRVPGLSNDTALTAYLWDNRVAAAAADNIALEASPGPGGRSLHIQLLAYLGMPIGELWDLDALAADCAEDGVYECFLTSAPNDLKGGYGSPPNAIAIK
jgi:hypothetical protein